MPYNYLQPQSAYSPYDPRYGIAGAIAHPQGTSLSAGSLPAYGSGTVGSTGLPSYNVNPSPLSGNGPYGQVPGTTGIPPSTYQQTLSVAPGLGTSQNQLTDNIISELQGQISPQALKNMQDAAARFGISSGMPGSNAIPGTLANNLNLRNIGLDTLAVQRQGQQDWQSALNTIGGQQINPALAAEISQANAQLLAAPNPQAAAEQQLANYWAALNAMRGPAGGSQQGLSPAGGTGQQGSGALGFGGLAGQGSPLGFGGLGTFGTTPPVDTRFAPPTLGSTGTGGPVQPGDWYYMGIDPYSGFMGTDGSTTYNQSGGAPLTEEDMSMWDLGLGG